MADSAIVQIASISKIDAGGMQMSQQELSRTTINDMPEEILLEIGKNLGSWKDYSSPCYIRYF